MTACSKCTSNSAYVISFPKTILNDEIKEGTKLYKADNRGGLHFFACSTHFDDAKSIFGRHQQFETIKSLVKYQALASKSSSISNLIS